MELTQDQITTFQNQISTLNTKISEFQTVLTAASAEIDRLKGATSETSE